MTDSGSPQRSSPAGSGHVAPHTGTTGRATRLLVGLAAAVVAGAGLHATSSIVAPTLLALVIAICVSPVRSWLERRGAPTGLATFAVLATVLVLLVAFVGALIIAVAQFSSLLPQYSKQLSDSLDAVSDWLKSLGISSAQVHALASNLDPNTIIHGILEFVGSALGMTGTLVLTLMVLFMMVIDAAYFPRALSKLRATRGPLIVALDGYTRNVRRYMVVTAVFGGAVAALDTVLLVVLNVPGALLWGFLSFVTSFIPNIGYWIALIPAVLFAWLSGGIVIAIIVFAAYAVINSILQTFVQPRFVGTAVAVSQTFAFLSLIVWAGILGPIGAILGIPLTLLARTLLIDADPNAHWMRPLTGDFTDARNEQRAAASSAKAERRARRSKN